MTKYVALVYFEDNQDDKTAYEVGTLFPREGVEVSDERLEKLSTSNNAQGRPVIAELKELPAKEIKTLEDYTVPQLKELADKENIEYPSNAVKKDLLELLKG